MRKTIHSTSTNKILQINHRILPFLTLHLHFIFLILVLQQFQLLHVHIASLLTKPAILTTLVDIISNKLLCAPTVIKHSNHHHYHYCRHSFQPHRKTQHDNRRDSFLVDFDYYLQDMQVLSRPSTSRSLICSSHSF